MLLPPSQVSSLNLSVNTLQDLGVAAIAFVADRCTSLTALNLNSAKITCAGAAAIAAAMYCQRALLPTNAAILQLLPASTRVPVAQVFKSGSNLSGCAACDAPHIEQLQLRLLQQGQGRQHATSGATGLTFLEQRFVCLFDRTGFGYKMQVTHNCRFMSCEVLVIRAISRVQGGWSVTDLDLSHNLLGAAGGLAIFEALKSNPQLSLRRLKLVSCKLGSAQLGVCMGKVLGGGECMCMLQELDVGWNDFDDAAMQACFLCHELHCICCVSLFVV